MLRFELNLLNLPCPKTNSSHSPSFPPLHHLQPFPPPLLVTRPAAISKHFPECHSLDKCYTISTPTCNSNKLCSTHPSTHPHTSQIPTQIHSSSPAAFGPESICMRLNNRHYSTSSQRGPVQPTLLPTATSDSPHTLPPSNKRFSNSQPCLRFLDTHATCRLTPLIIMT